MAVFSSKTAPEESKQQQLQHSTTNTINTHHHHNPNDSRFRITHPPTLQQQHAKLLVDRNYGLHQFQLPIVLDYERLLCVMKSASILQSLLNPIQTIARYLDARLHRLLPLFALTVTRQCR